MRPILGRYTKRRREMREGRYHERKRAERHKIYNHKLKLCETKRMRSEY